MVWNVSQYCHRIYSGREKTNESPVTITTMAVNITNCKKPFFDGFEVAIGDEAHLFKSKSTCKYHDKDE